MRVLGVDPGLGRAGVAVVEGAPGNLSLVHAGCLETGAADPVPERLLRLFEMVAALVAQHRPDVAAVERLFLTTNRRTAMRVGEARGVVLCAVARGGVAVAEYTPTQVKEAVAGFGGADKPQVARMASRLLGVDAIAGPDDVADACAVAICHHHRHALGVRAAGAAAGVSPSLERAVQAALARTGAAGSSRHAAEAAP